MENKKPLSLTYLLGTGVSVSLIFLTGEMVIKFGALVGISLVTTYIIASLLVIPFIKRDVNNSNLRKVIEFIYYLEVILLNVFIGSTLLVSVFHFNTLASIFISLFCILLFSLMLEKISYFRLSITLINLLLMFALSIFLTNYIYLQEGLETVYHNLLHYHPEVLHLQKENQATIFCLSLFIIWTKLYIQIPKYQRYTENQSGFELKKLIVGALIFAMLILAFSTMTIVAITQNLESNNMNELLILLIKQKSSSFLFHLIIFVFYILTLISATIKFTDSKVMTGRYSKFLSKFILISVLIASYLTFHFQISFLNLYLYTGLIIIFLLLISIIESKVVKIFKKVRKIFKKY